MYNIGKVLRQLRIKRNYTKDYIQEKTGVSQWTQKAIEEGHRQGNIGTINAILSVYGKELAIRDIK